MVRRAFVALALGTLLSGCFRHPPAPKPPRADIAAISDLHLGDPRSLLEDEAGRAVLLDALATACDLRGVHTLVLDGDVLELALASEPSAYRSARDLFRDLDRIRGLERVVVVVGNHDHRLFEDIPDPLPEKLGREYHEGTRIHRELAEVVNRLQITVVYPGWTVPVAGGSVHFTHGHYFDRVITPKFDGSKSVAELEEANQEWWSFLNAGGVSTPIRELYRSAYHFGHHVKGLVDSVKGSDPEAEPEEMSGREQARIEVYLTEHVKDPTVYALVSGHTHANGGRVQSVLVHGREVGVLDPGAFVVGHHGGKPRPHMFLLDAKSGEIRVERLRFPEDVLDETRARAFETVP